MQLISLDELVKLDFKRINSSFMSFTNHDNLSFHQELVPKKNVKLKVVFIAITIF